MTSAILVDASAPHVRPSTSSTARKGHGRLRVVAAIADVRGARRILDAPRGYRVPRLEGVELAVALDTLEGEDAERWAREGTTRARYTFAPVAADVAATSYTDSSVDQYVAYTYRALAVNAGGASAPSNEDTAGPPPSKLQSATKNPTDQGKVHRFGTHTSLALDDNDDPILAFDGEFDVNGTGDTDVAYFMGWDRTSSGRAERALRLGLRPWTGNSATRACLL